MTGPVTHALKVAEFEKTRAQWVDVAKGIGIVLVVWGHVLRGNKNLERDHLAAAQDHWIYAFHMPLFFLLAGLFIWRGCARGRLVFLQRRWWTVIWPYLLWSIVCGIVALAAGKYVNVPITFRDVLAIPVRPIEQFWFLYALLLCQIICALAYSSVLRLLVLTGMALVAFRWLPGPGIALQAFRYLPFMVAGVIFTDRLAAVSEAGSSTQVALTIGGVAVLILSMETIDWTSNQYEIFILNGFSGSIACIGLAMLACRIELRGSHVLAKLGRASLAIFVLHTLFSAGTRITLSHLGVAPGSVASLASCFALGLLVPWAIFHKAQRAGVSRGLGFNGG